MRAWISQQPQRRGETNFPFLNDLFLIFCNISPSTRLVFKYSLFQLPFSLNCSVNTFTLITHLFRLDIIQSDQPPATSETKESSSQPDRGRPSPLRVPRTPFFIHALLLLAGTPAHHTQEQTLLQPHCFQYEQSYLHT